MSFILMILGIVVGMAAYMEYKNHNKYNDKAFETYKPKLK